MTDLRRRTARVIASPRGIGAAVALLVGVAGAGCSPYRLPPPSPRLATLPATLSAAGLYRDSQLRQLASDLRPYRPSFELWSDGATKRRWIRLPPGAAIDSSDLDDWRFPVGTELWKEFSVNGTRVETRLLAHVAPGDDGWAAVAYVWNAAQTDAVAAPDGMLGAAGTTHDVPPARACMTCHGGRASRVLGFSAIQLAHPPHTDDTRELTLDALVVERRLTTTPPPLVVPGDPIAVAALGYLHVNCGSCHNAARPASARFFRPRSDLDLWLTTATLATTAATPAYRTVVDPPQVLDRFEHAGVLRRRMPPLATNVVDPAGDLILSRWVRRLRGG